MENFQTVLIKNAQAVGLALTAEQAEKLSAYFAMLEEASKSFNLISYTDVEEMVTRHFLDALAAPALKLLAPFRNIIDVGTGAGFPGLPLAIVLNRPQITLLDSLRKRTDFLQTVVEKLALPNTTVVHARAEDYARTACRERYDAALSRAVASLPVLLEYTLPFVRVGGAVLAWKGPSAPAEIAEAEHAASILGSRELKAHPYTISEHQNFFIVEAKKFRPAPSIYPRKAGIPTKNPLK